MFVVVVVILQGFFMMAVLYNPLDGPFDSEYRHEQRVNAYWDWLKVPSPSTKAAYHEEMRLLRAHTRRRDLLISGLVLLEGVGLTILWNRKPAVTKGQGPDGGPE